MSLQRCSFLSLLAWRCGAVSLLRSETSHENNQIPPNGVDVETNSTEFAHPFSADTLWAKLKDFDADHDGAVSATELNTALTTKDEWGQTFDNVHFPERKALMQVDVNKDGLISEAEAKTWNGLKGQACRNFADQLYGCTRRCTNGHIRSSGLGKYFQEQYSKFIFEDPAAGFPSSKTHPDHHEWGTMSWSQAGALEHALAHVLSNKVPGAITEFGVYDGGTSHRLMDVLNKVNETHRAVHFYDSFAGLPVCDRVRDAGMCALGNMAFSLERFQKQFGGFYKGDMQLHKNIFQKLTDKDMPEQIAYAFLDGDLYGSIKSSLEVVYPRLAKGAVVLVHDWGWEGYPGTEMATSEFLADKPEKMMVPAYGKDGGFACYLGLLIKQ